MTTVSEAMRRHEERMSDEPVRVAPASDARYLRTFPTGSTRSPDAGRIDPEGYLSPLVIERFSWYMLKHQVQSDGTKRESDNWQKGMSKESYIKGLWRHVLHLWQRHRGWTVTDSKAGHDIQEDLCAIIFNAQGYLHELLKKEPVLVRWPHETGAST